MNLFNFQRLTREELEKVALCLMQKNILLEEKFENNKIIKTFDTFIKEWLELRKPKLSATTYRGYYNIVYKHLIDYFGDINLREISSWDIERYYNCKLSKISENTIKKHYTILKIIFKKAKNFHYIDENPMNLVEHISLTKPKTNYYSIDDLIILFKKTRVTRFYPVILLCSLGLRRSEALGVKWENINFETSELKICGKICPETDEYTKALKTSSSYRTIVIPKIMMIEFQSLHFLRKCEWVCESKKKTHLSNSAASTGLRYYIKKNELKPITLKGLRHTCATILSKEGYNLNYVKNWLGHSTIKLTADTYSHVDLSDKKKIANSLNKILII